MEISIGTIVEYETILGSPGHPHNELLPWNTKIPPGIVGLPPTLSYFVEY